MIRYSRILFGILLHQVFTYVSTHPGNCTFNYDLCGWTQPMRYPYGWWSQVTEDGHNFYLRLLPTDGQIHRARLESVQLQDTGAQCLTFAFRTKRHYKGYGYSGTLNVSLVINGSEHHLVNIQEGNYDYVWQTFFLNVRNIQSSVDFKIRFSASVTHGDDMYIGNIQLLNGPCKLECNFEDDICGLMISSFQRIAYNGFTYPWPDHTINKVGGHYLYQESIYPTATLENINFFLYEFLCLTFWYQMSGYTSAISVIVYTANNPYFLVWKKSGQQSNAWLPATINVEVPSQTMVTIRILREYRLQYSEIGLDDLAITSVSCSDCNFLDGFCNWDGSSGWKIASNGSNYAYPECNSRNESTLTSRSEIFPGKKCLSLLHFIEYNDIKYIEVGSQTGVKWNPIWDNTREKQITVWTTTHININLMEKSMIGISVMHSHGCSERYAIRSISLKQGWCTETTTTTTSVYATSIIPKYDASYTSIRTTAATTNTTTATTTETTNRTNRTNVHGTENTVLQMTEDESSSAVSVGVIVGIVIGCLGLVGAVSLAAIYVYRRRQASSTRKKDPRKSTVTNTTYSGMSRTKNANKNTMSSMERHQKCTPSPESVYYNAHAEYATVEKKRLRQNQTQHISTSRDINVYSLAGSLPDTIKTLSDCTYNHTNEFHDDAYDSTIPSATRPSDETYSHTDFKSTLDNIYTNSSFTDESIHNTTIMFSNQDFEPTYNNTCNVVYDGVHAIIDTATEDADNNYDHTC